MTDGSLTETDGSLTDTHGSGGQWSRRRWASVRWILGLCWGGVLVCRCAGVTVCMCAGVPAIAVVYQYTGVQHFRRFRNNFPSIVLCVCYNYPMILQLPLCLSSASFRFSKWFRYDFLWISYEFLLFVYGFLCFFPVRMSVWFSCEFPSEFL